MTEQPGLPASHLDAQIHGAPPDEFELVPALVTLVRIGFLVDIKSPSGTSDRSAAALVGLVHEPQIRELLLTILQAKDTAAAIATVMKEVDTP